MKCEIMVCIMAIHLIIRTRLVEIGAKGGYLRKIKIIVLAM
jgi:hypothetical protein